MIVLTPGHLYELQNRTIAGDVYPLNHLAFLNKESEPRLNGTTTQEVLRALIDRVKYVNGRVPHENNSRILYHLRMAIALHEGRAIEQKVAKKEIQIERVTVGEDGHFLLTQK